MWRNQNELTSNSIGLEWRKRYSEMEPGVQRGFDRLRRGDFAFLRVLAYASLSFAAPDWPGGASAQPGKIGDRSSTRPLSEAIEREHGGLMFRIPRAYMEVGLGSSGFALWVRADDFGPFKPLPASQMGRLGIDVTVSNSRFPAEEGVRRSIYSSIFVVPRHPPAAEASVVEDLDFGPVPEGLRFFKALPAPGPGSGVREDMFVPDGTIEGTGLYDIREAIFCLSPESSHVREGDYPAGRRPCNWLLSHRGLELTLGLDRTHLARWRHVRAGVLALLDSFVAEPKD